MTMNKKTYISPEIRVIATEDLCEMDLKAVSVVRVNEKEQKITPVDNFAVKRWEDSNIDWDDTDNWGGD